ncbi:acyl carrier protein [Geomonas sp. Red69]|uniref:acyl carrier protein n=1 Tax=Geomonas diazotrophica TaxID=2843197 RepID=UPI001C0F8F5B|nr:phosphopantetheine-binding protein [Geomonas diazotrophica]MBU5637878.1 acyl carrier protein [Geomonas diazotrophica]
MNLKDEIRNFVVETFLFGDAGGLTDDSSFIREGIIDSTGILQLVAYLQERYQVAVADDELIPENLDSVQRVAAFVEGKRNGASCAGSEG